MEYEVVNPEDLNLEKNKTEELKQKAIDYFKSKKIVPVYRAKGLVNYKPATLYFKVSDADVALLKEIHSNHPDEDVSYALQSEGQNGLFEDFWGDCCFWVESIDLDNPVNRYRFSVLEASQHTFRVYDRVTVYVTLEDGEYVELLTSRLMNPTFTYNDLALACPDIYKTIKTQIESPEEDFISFGDHPYIVFMEEVEDDVRTIEGGTCFSSEMYEDIQCGVTIFFYSKKGVSSVEKEVVEPCDFYDHRSGRQLFKSMSFYELKSIPSDKLMSVLNVEYEEDLPSVVASRFNGENSLDEFKAFLTSNEIPFDYEEKGYFL